MKKITLITGANKGLGFESARQLGALGHTVLVGARDEKRGEEAAQTLRNEGHDAQFLMISPTDADSIHNAVREIESKFGRLDVLFNNAGVMLPIDFGDPVQLPLSAMRETFEINVFGMHSVTQAFWPLLNKSSAARLVNQSSALGSLTLQAGGTMPIHPIAYDASKAAINMMTIHYALVWKDTPHRANAANPGNVKTDANPYGELTVEVGAKTGVLLATLGEDGPNGGFFDMGNPLPW